MSRTNTTSSMPHGGDARASKSKSWVITLPVEMRSNEAGLRITAANLLDLAPVHSVVIDGSRRQAVVRLRANRASGLGLGEIPAVPWSESATTHDSANAARTPVVSWIDPRNQSLCFIKLPARARGWRQLLLVLAAGAALSLGFVGIVLPGLPTTPFVLVASYCLLRSSPKLHARLLHSRLFGSVLRDWHIHRGIRSHVRYKAMAVITLVLCASLIFTAMPLVAKLAILAVATIGILYVWRLPDIAE